MRYMFMTDIYDEKEFDSFAAKLTVRGLGNKITKPFLIIAGEDDEPAPISDAYAFYEELAGPKKMITYEARSTRFQVSTGFISALASYTRVIDRPLTSESVYIDITGREVKGWAPSMPSI